MRNRPATALMRKSIVSSVVLAGLTSLSLLGHIEPMSAATMTACQGKHMECSERCIMNSDSYSGGNACIQRTCTHQFKACAAVSGESKDPYHSYGLKDRTRGPKPDASAGGGRGGRPGRPSRPGRGGGATQLISPSPSGPAGEVRMPRGGLLDSLGVLGNRQQGPAATGSPMAPAAAPSAPPVIIR
jgi:hypothetical protein